MLSSLIPRCRFPSCTLCSSEVVILHQLSRDMCLHLPPPLPVIFFFPSSCCFSKVANNFPKAGHDWRLNLFLGWQSCTWHCTMLLVVIQAKGLTEQNMGRDLVWFISLQWWVVSAIRLSLTHVMQWDEELSSASLRILLVQLLTCFCVTDINRNFKLQNN